MIKIKTPYGSHIFYAQDSLKGFNNFQLEVPIPSLFPDSVRKKIEEEEKLKKSQTIEQLITESNQLVLQHQYDKALMPIEEILSRDDKNFRALSLKGSIFFLKGDKALARQYWSSALKINPQNLELKKQLEKTHE